MLSLSSRGRDAHLEALGHRNNTRRLARCCTCLSVLTYASADFRFTSEALPYKSWSSFLVELLTADILQTLLPTSASRLISSYNIPWLSGLKIEGNSTRDLFALIVHWQVNLLQIPGRLVPLTDHEHRFRFPTCLSIQVSEFILTKLSPSPPFISWLSVQHGRRLVGRWPSRSCWWCWRSHGRPELGPDNNEI